MKTTYPQKPVVSVLKNKAFTLIEVLVVAVILGLLSTVALQLYDSYTTHAKIAATRMNHSKIKNMIESKVALCRVGGSIEYLDRNGAENTFTCPQTIAAFIGFMNAHIYGMDWENPFYPRELPNASWCRLNVTNCVPPGYMAACPTNVQQSGYISVFTINNTTIGVCSNLGNSTGATEYEQDEISYAGIRQP